MTPVTIKFLEEVIKPKLSEDEYKEVLKMYYKNVSNKLKKTNHIDRRTGIGMTTCGKNCWHNEK